MKISFDQTTDYSHRELYQVLEGKSIPTFVKEAELDEEDVIAGLKTADFAAEYHRAFPINTPAATFLSNAYFVNKQAELRKIWGPYTYKVACKLKDAAAKHNISADVEKYNAEFKVANEKDYPIEYMYVAKVEGSDFPLFPVKTAEDLTKQAEAFADNVNKLFFEWRSPIAEAFVKKAKELGVDELPDILCKYAGLFYPESSIVADELDRRSRLIKDASVKEEFLKLIDQAEACVSKDDYFKVAEQVQKLELQDSTGFNVKIAGVRGDVVDKMFTLTIEKVAEMLDFVTVGSNKYRVEDLQKVSSDIYKQAFDIELDPKNAEAIRDIMPTMPLSDMFLFRELSGVNPI